ncbi:MAG: hypothetical protein HZA94_03100 [Candidatus Vogelbacteria bacterium]|nr:hypothetical protein [Candidatus Vogelbacteria bacterium]
MGYRLFDNTPTEVGEGEKMTHHLFWLPPQNKESDIEIGQIDKEDPRKNCRFCKSTAAYKASAGAKDGSGSTISIVVCLGDKCLNMAKGEIQDILKHQKEKPANRETVDKAICEKRPTRRLTLNERLTLKKRRE